VTGRFAPWLSEAPTGRSGWAAGWSQRKKANTAYAFSLDSSYDSNGSRKPNGLSPSTASLYSAVQPGGSLYGLEASKPLNTDVPYRGPAANYGTANDPIVGGVIGGVNVFSGGLALYAARKVLVAGVGVSGDTSCADHMIAWRVRNNLDWITWRESAA